MTPNIVQMDQRRGLISESQRGVSLHSVGLGIMSLSIPGDLYAKTCSFRLLRTFVSFSQCQLRDALPISPLRALLCTANTSWVMLS